jgi:hypothetical protein
MDTFASIISNNLNHSHEAAHLGDDCVDGADLDSEFFMGMNVDHLPFAHHSYSFVIVFGFSILLSVAMTWFFVRKNWF